MAARYKNLIPNPQVIELDDCENDLQLKLKKLFAF